MKKLGAVLLLLLVTPCVGCGGSNAAIMPDGEMTEEQIEAVKAEDAAIEDEEMGGGMPPVKKKR